MRVCQQRKGRTLPHCACEPLRPTCPPPPCRAPTCLRMDVKEGMRFLKGRGSTLTQSCSAHSAADMTAGSCKERGGPAAVPR